jgi:Fe-coproporphyrin III synthase
LGSTLLSQAIADAAREGYDVVSFSGGEPLVYKPLNKLLREARERQLISAVTSNGLLLNASRLEMLRDTLDLLALSLDGIPESHNRLRASPRAFADLLSKLPLVRNADLAFGFIFTLTEHNVDELEWVAAFARDQGASLLQIHPLEQAGRATEQLSGATPDSTELVFGYLETLRLQALFGEHCPIHLDICDRETFLRSPTSVFAGAEPEDAARLPLSALVSPLIVEADGTVVPLCFGFPRAFSIGSLYEAPLRDLAIRWRRESYDAFRGVCQMVFESVSRQGDLEFFNWYEMVRAAANKWHTRSAYR